MSFNWPHTNQPTNQPMEAAEIRPEAERLSAALAEKEAALAALGKEAAVVGIAAIAGAFLLLFASLYATQSKSPLKEQPVENIDPGVCLSGKCANGARRVKALEFTSDRFADDRNAARAENPEPFLE